MLIVQDGDIGQIAILIIEIEAIAYHEGVGNGESAIIGLQGNLLPPFFSQKNCHAQGGHFQTAQMMDQVMQGLARVENVVEQEHMAAAQIGRHLRINVQRAGRRGGAAIAGGLNQRDSEPQIEPADEVRQENEAARQHANNGNWLVAIVRCNLLGKLANPLLNALG